MHLRRDDGHVWMLEDAFDLLKELEADLARPATVTERRELTDRMGDASYANGMRRGCYVHDPSRPRVTHQEGPIAAMRRWAEKRYGECS